jgi:hypothetical protein
MTIINRNITLFAWVYDDGCQITCLGKDYYFEGLDFSSLDEMLQSFLLSISSLINGKEPSQKTSSRINIFTCGKL